MIGMDRHTGLPISGIEHLRQSIADILGTPLGSRVMRPEYGSKVRRFVDLPVNPGWKSAVQAEAARALGRWDKRLVLERLRRRSRPARRRAAPRSGRTQRSRALHP